MRGGVEVDLLLRACSHVLQAPDEDPRASSEFKVPESGRLLGSDLPRARG
jgi:hypothetical protein